MRKLISRFDWRLIEIREEEEEENRGNNKVQSELEFIFVCLAYNLAPEIKYINLICFTFYF